LREGLERGADHLAQHRRCRRALVGHAAHYLLITTALIFEQVELANQIFGQVTAQERTVGGDGL